MIAALAAALAMAMTPSAHCMVFDNEVKGQAICLQGVEVAVYDFIPGDDMLEWNRVQ